MDWIAAPLLGVMGVLALLIGWWSRQLRAMSPTVRGVAWRAGGWRHPLGCVAVWLIVVPIAALLPVLALVPSAIFLVLAVRSFRRAAPPRRAVAGVLSLCALVWLAYWGYETLMRAWMGTVTAPIRVDFMITAPLLYYVSVVGLSLDGSGPAS